MHDDRELYSMSQIYWCGHMCVCSIPSKLAPFFPPSENSFRLFCMSDAIIDNACVSPRLRALAYAGSGGDMMEAGDEKRLRKRGKCHPPVATPHREFNSSWKARWISSLTICYACKNREPLVLLITHSLCVITMEWCLKSK